ncbi:gene transfer agent family protein [Caulobacter endophyticus]|uniref:Uncharacterized protein n=1 Tax=Caulobacter endophyticus TaxID=2172652 RepID=A0A2T9K3V5_9CAUL|nr:gene transfer agent family protein [Caulobacter endophyticus]PVM90662.1 hypothetical protein DDF67_09530 [Caulobacter endophyticus]
MDGSGHCTTEFAGEERDFRIRLGEIRRIEKACGTGIGEVLRRLARAVFALSKYSGIEALAAGVEFHAEDVRAPIYQGLIGAGMTSKDATNLVRLDIDERGIQGLLDHATTALEVLWASRQAPEDEEPGEPIAGESPAN